MFTVRLLGGASLEGPDGLVTGRAGLRQRIALVAMLAAEHPRPVSRDRLIAHLWPESDTANARHLLSESLYILRSATTDDAVIGTGDGLRLNPAVLACDVWELEAAYSQDELERAVDLYRGPFLSGFHLSDTEDFERWVDKERDRLARRHLQTLEKLAEREMTRGNAKRAAEWWFRVTTEDPLNSRVAFRYMQALEASGDRAAALRFASTHSELLREELDAVPDAGVTALAEQLKRESRSVASFPTHAPPVTAGVSDIATPTNTTALPAGAAESLVGPTVVLGRAQTRRWAAALGGAGIVVALGVIGGALSHARSSPLDPRRVAAAPFENRTGRRDLDDLGALAADWVMRGIHETPMLAVGDVEAVYAPSPTDPAHAADPLSVARQEGAAMLVHGSYYRSGDSVLFQARVMDVASGRLLRSFDPVGAPVNRAIDALATLRERLASGVGPLLNTFDRGNPIDPDLDPPPSLAAYREFVAGINVGRLGDWAAESQHYREAARIDSTFAAPLVQLAFRAAIFDECAVTDSVARVLQPRRAHLSPWNRFTIDAFRAFCQGDPGEVVHQAELRYAAYPHSGSARAHFARALAHNNQPRALREVLLHMNPEHDFGWYDSAKDVWPRYWWLMAGTWHVLGGYEKELEITNRWVDSSALEWRDTRARAFAALGRDSDAVALTNLMTHNADELLGVSMELAAHGHQRAARVVAESLLARLDSTTPADWSRAWDAASADRLLDRAAAEQMALESVTVGDVDTVTWLEREGRLAVLRGDTAGAERIDRQLAKQSDRPLRSPLVRATAIVSRAHIAAGFGRRERAVDLLADAQSRGIFPMGSSYAYHADPLLAPLRGYPPFEALLHPDQ